MRISNHTVQTSQNDICVSGGEVGNNYENEYEGNNNTCEPKSGGGGDKNYDLREDNSQNTLDEVSGDSVYNSFQRANGFNVWSKYGGKYSGL